MIYLINNLNKILYQSTVFALVTVIFIISMLTTITSFREIPLKLLESDEMMRPVTQVAVKKEKERLKSLEGMPKETPSIIATVISEKQSNGNINGVALPQNYSGANRNSNASVSSSSDDDEDDHEESHITFVSFFC